MLYFAIAVSALFALMIVQVIWDRYKMRRLTRRLCDAALYYAIKRRRAFDEPDYTPDELSTIRLTQKKRDFTEVGRIIGRYDRKMREQRNSEKNKDVMKATADEAIAIRRDAEIRLYRA